MAAIQTGTDRLSVVLSLIEPTPGDKQICADPPELTILDGESVCWDVRVEEGDRVTIEFEEAECGEERRRGPFEPGPDAPAPGLLESKGPGRVQSSKASAESAPIRPMTKTIPPTGDFRSPRASSIPWTG